MDDTVYKRKDPNFLKTKLLEPDNLYTGSIPYKANHAVLYASFVVLFRKSIYYDDEIIKMTTAKDFKVTPYENVVVFNYELDETRVNCLKLHLAQNFFVNWDTYDKYIYKMYQDDKDRENVTIASISSDAIFIQSFNKDIETKEIYADILFIHILSNRPDFKKGIYAEETRMVINIRKSLGLVTIVIYNGPKENWLNEEYGKMFGITWKELTLLPKDGLGLLNYQSNKSEPETPTKVDVKRDLDWYDIEEELSNGGMK